MDLSLFLFGRIQEYKVVEHKKVAGQIKELKLNTVHRNGKGEMFVSWLKGQEATRSLKIESDELIIEGDFLRKTLKVNSETIECNVLNWVKADNNQVKDELVDFFAYCFSKDEFISKPLFSMEEISRTVEIIENISKSLN